MKKHLNWDEVRHDLHEVEYPNDLIQEFGGIPKNTSAWYVTSDFVGGLMGYIRANAQNLRLFLYQNYGIEDAKGRRVLPKEGETAQQQYEAIALELAQSDMIELCTGRTDDMFVFIESHTGYWIFWLDRANRSMIVHLWKETFGGNTFDEIVELFLAFNSEKSTPGGIQPAIAEVKAKDGGDHLPHFKY